MEKTFSIRITMTEVVTLIISLILKCHSRWLCQPILSASSTRTSATITIIMPMRKKKRATMQAQCALLSRKL